jgi:hypothetical protein
MLQVSLDGSKKQFQPGEAISGTASWQLTESPEAIEIHLCFYTEGKGTSDVLIVETIRVASPPGSGSEKFSWSLPKSPYSFSGKLISLIWAVEIVTLSSAEAESVEFEMSPTGSEINLIKS